jgi:hypothetical protein
LPLPREAAGCESFRLHSQNFISKPFRRRPIKYFKWHFHLPEVNVAPVARNISASTMTRRIDYSDVDLSHRHHRIELALGGGRIGVDDRFHQDDRRDVPRQSRFVTAPAALALLAAVGPKANRVLCLVRQIISLLMLNSLIPATLLKKFKSCQ